MSQAPEVKPNTFNFLVGLDFGTDGTALAFATPNSKEVYFKQDWNERTKHNKENFGCKMKTHILLNRIKTKFNDSNDYKYEFVAFGGEARTKYKNKNNYKSENWLYFESFKMALFEGKCTTNEKVCINKHLTSKNGIEIKSSIVFIEAFKYLIKQAKSFIEKFEIKLFNGLNGIQWIITVPAIWNDKSKHLMIEWFHSALGNDISKDKILKDQVKLEYEPDCASITVLHELQEKSSDNLKIGDRYILIDLGGGTCDYACHEILNNDKISEIYHPSGGAWGSTYVDKEFDKLLYDIFGKKLIDEFKIKYESDYMELMDNFIEASKLNFFYTNFKNGTFVKKVKSKSKHHIALPLKFYDYINSNIENDLEDYIDEYKYKNKSDLVELISTHLSLNYVIWFDLFNVCINPIISHLRDLLDNKVKNISSVILVGGFSESKYIQYKITQNFGLESDYKLNIIIPERPLLAVVQGSVRLGLNNNYKYEKKLSKTYGTGCNYLPEKAREIGATQEYIKKNNFYDLSYGEKFITNCFNIFATKNQGIKKGEKITHSYRRVSNSKYMPIYCSDLVNPYTINENQSTQIGFILIPDSIQFQTIYEIQFYFSGSVIKVFVLDKKKNCVSQTKIKYN